MSADVNAADSEGKTPLHEAILQGNGDVVEYLLKHGANVHLRTSSGESPLITAVLREDPSIIRILLQCGAHLSEADTCCVSDVIGASIKKNCISRLEALKLAGANFNITDDMGQTPLHKAILRNRFDVVQYLLRDVAVNVDTKDIFGNTPKDYAKQLKRNDLFNLFK